MLVNLQPLSSFVPKFNPICISQNDHFAPKSAFKSVLQKEGAPKDEADSKNKLNSAVNKISQSTIQLALFRAYTRVVEIKMVMLIIH